MQTHHVAGGSAADLQITLWPVHSLCADKNKAKWQCIALQDPWICDIIKSLKQLQHVTRFTAK